MRVARIWWIRFISNTAEGTDTKHTGIQFGASAWCGFCDANNNFCLFKLHVVALLRPQTSLRPLFAINLMQWRETLFDKNNHPNIFAINILVEIVEKLWGSHIVYNWLYHSPPPRPLCNCTSITQSPLSVTSQTHTKIQINLKNNNFFDMSAVSVVKKIFIHFKHLFVSTILINSLCKDLFSLICVSIYHETI